MITLALAGVTLVISVVPAALVAVGREFGPPTLAWALGASVTVVRGIPAMVGLVGLDRAPDPGCRRRALGIGRVLVRFDRRHQAGLEHLGDLFPLLPVRPN